MAGALMSQPRRRFFEDVVDGQVCRWFTDNLWREAAGLPEEDVPLEQLEACLDMNGWFRPGVVPTPRNISEHWGRIQDADLSFPILLDADGCLMDGMHRIMKAHGLGHSTIRAIRFAERPKPDEVLPMSPEQRPPFIVSTEAVEEDSHNYPGSAEKMGASCAIGRAAGLLKIGLHVQTLEPGQRSSWPHAEEKEEEFVFVLEGTVHAWVDGELHQMVAGDLIAFPAGTGMSHTILNNSKETARLLVGGERSKSDNRIFYPLHPERRDDFPWSFWWDDHPERELGPHDGLPDAQR